MSAMTTENHLRSKVRFSLLHLEPGEFFFENYSCTYKREDSQNLETTWRKLMVDKTVKGKLKVCSKSLVFDAHLPEIPVIKIPFKNCLSIEKGDDFTNKSFNGSSHTVDVVSENSIELLEKRKIKPYVISPEIVKHSFELLNKTENVLPQILQLYRASTLPPNDHNTMANAMSRSLLNRHKFDAKCLKEDNEEILVDITASKVYHLVSNPGRVALSSKNLYFQPYNSFEQNRLAVISLNKISHVNKRRYMLRQLGLELVFKGQNNHNLETNDSYIFLTFSKQEDRDFVYDTLIKQEVLSLDNIMSDNMIYRWQVGAISNFEYLKYLNSQADRSENDMTQYPVYPWVITDYRSETLDLNNPSIYRDLSKPIGAINEVRLKKLKERYQDMAEPKFLYGSHYSTPGFVLYYLVRRYPEAMLCLNNGRFDNPDRMFNCFAATWDNVTNNQSDFKELIPEFYNTNSNAEDLGDFLVNKHNYPLGIRQNGKPVQDVELPPWAKSPQDFVIKMRMALESDYVSVNLHHWIDLIFGHKQTGNDAIEADNVFYHLCYEGSVDVSVIEDINEKNALEVQIREFGQIPKQLFYKPHPRRSKSFCLYDKFSPIFSMSSSISDLSEEWEDFKGELEELQLESMRPAIPPLLYYLHQNVLSITKSYESKMHSSEVTHVMFTLDNRIAISLGKDSFIKGVSLLDNEMVISENAGNDTLTSCVQLPGTGELLIGSWNGSMYKYNLLSGKILEIIEAHTEAISCMDSLKDFVVTGSVDGVAKVWRLKELEKNGAEQWSCWHIGHLVSELYHDDAVESVKIHPALAYIASANLNGELFVWLSTGRVKHRLQCHSGKITGLAWCPEGNRLLTSGINGKLVIIDANQGSIISTVNLQEQINCIAWDGRMVLAGGSSGNIFFYDMGKEEIVKIIHAHSGAINAICISNDGCRIVTGGDDHKIITWSAPSYLSSSPSSTRGSSPSSQRLLMTNLKCNSNFDKGFSNTPNENTLKIITSLSPSKKATNQLEGSGNSFEEITVACCGSSSF